MMRTAGLVFLLYSFVAIAGEPQPASSAPETEEAHMKNAADEHAAQEPEETPQRDFKAPAGYKKKTKRGSTFYCRTETPVGTRFPTEYCFTEDQLRRMEAANQHMRDDVAHRQQTCAGSSCMGD